MQRDTRELGAHAVASKILNFSFILAQRSSLSYSWIPIIEQDTITLSISVLYINETVTF